jgi:hypothetical protein
MIGTEAGEMSVTLLTGEATANYRFDDLETTCFDVGDLDHAKHMVDQLLCALEIAPPFINQAVAEKLDCGQAL